MAYNKDMFDKAGVPYPKDGWNMEDLLKWGKPFVGGSGAKNLRSCKALVDGLGYVICWRWQALF